MLLILRPLTRRRHVQFHPIVIGEFCLCFGGFSLFWPLASLPLPLLRSLSRSLSRPSLLRSVKKSIHVYCVHNTSFMARLESIVMHTKLAHRQDSNMHDIVDNNETCRMWHIYHLPFRAPKEKIKNKSQLSWVEWSRYTFSPGATQLFVYVCVARRHFGNNWDHARSPACARHRDQIIDAPKSKTNDRECGISITFYCMSLFSIDDATHRSQTSLCRFSSASSSSSSSSSSSCSSVWIWCAPMRLQLDPNSSVNHSIACAQIPSVWFSLTRRWCALMRSPSSMSLSSPP